jgi:hypothetical protein
MKVTLDIDDRVFHAVKREAALQGRTMSEFVETALRKLLDPEPSGVELPTMPTFNSGGTSVDIADRDALYEAMER